MKKTSERKRANRKAQLAEQSAELLARSIMERFGPEEWKSKVKEFSSAVVEAFDFDLANYRRSVLRHIKTAAK